jgi:hypothetical protein
LASLSDRHSTLAVAISDNVGLWHIASLQCNAEFGRYQGIAHIAGLAARSNRSRMTLSGLQRVGSMLVRFRNPSVELVAFL